MGHYIADGPHGVTNGRYRSPDPGASDIAVQGEPHRNRTDGEADALPTIGLLSISRVVFRARNKTSTLLRQPWKSPNLLGTERVVRVVDHDRGDLPSGVCLLQQVHDTVPLQLLPVGLATYGDAPGNHAGCAQPFKAKVG